MNGATTNGAASKWLWLLVALWIIPMVVITVRVATRPHKRTVTPLYHDAVARWAKQQPLYDGPAGMNYLPSFVPLFAPFHALPLRAADLLWRYTAAAGLAYGIWAFIRKKSQEDLRAFALVSLLALPLSLGALSNGQANAHLGLALMLGALFLSRSQWTAAALCIALAVAIKPLGLAAAGLAFMAYPRLWWRLGLCIAAVLLLPAIVGPPDYALEQYRAAVANLRQCSEVTENRFADLNGLLRTIGIPLTGRPSLLVRGIAGVGFALFCLVAVRNLEPRTRALAWLAASACYLMLFNPMTEANSYVIFAPPAALWVWHFFTSGRVRLAWSIAASVLAMSILPTLLWTVVGPFFSLAFYPIVAALLMILVASYVIQSRQTPVAPHGT